LNPALQLCSTPVPKPHQKKAKDMIQLPKETETRKIGEFAQMACTSAAQPVATNQNTKTGCCSPCWKKELVD